jgi:hypothetical protein
MEGTHWDNGSLPTRTYMARDCLDRAPWDKRLLRCYARCPPKLVAAPSFLPYHEGTRLWAFLSVLLRASAPPRPDVPVCSTSFGGLLDQAAINVRMAARFLTAHRSRSSKSRARTRDLGARPVGPSCACFCPLATGSVSPCILRSHSRQSRCWVTLRRGQTTANTSKPTGQIVTLPT